MDTWTEARDRKVAKTIREAIAEAHQIYDDEPLPDTTTRDGVVEILDRNLVFFIDIFEADVGDRQWAELATTAIWLDRLQVAFDYVADLGLPT